MAKLSLRVNFRGGCRGTPEIFIEKLSSTKGPRYNFSFAFHLKEKPLELTFKIDLMQ